ncbi:uncharacterized protein LOC143032133 isoform X3 [Oratosquilla oratoria]|uniref:uncharacterized protein LOC143032133 isoform X3 n=1 Tax=Oratosquilla oratoria TaxID=337810 RepID=UPI003F7631AC
MSNEISRTFILYAAAAVPAASIAVTAASTATAVAVTAASTATAVAVAAAVDAFDAAAAIADDFIQHERIPESLDDTQPRFPIARQSMAQVDCPNGI